MKAWMFHFTYNCSSEYYSAAHTLYLGEVEVLKKGKKRATLATRTNCSGFLNQVPVAALYDTEAQCRVAAAKVIGEAYRKLLDQAELMVRQANNLLSGDPISQGVNVKKEDHGN